MNDATKRAAVKLGSSRARVSAMHTGSQSLGRPLVFLPVVADEVVE
jgi:hypothetical protein